MAETEPITTTSTRIPKKEGASLEPIPPKTSENKLTYLLPAIAVIILLSYFLVLPTLTMKNPLLTGQQVNNIIGTSACYTATITNNSLSDYANQFPQIKGNVTFGWGFQCKKITTTYNETLSELIFQTNSSASVASSLYYYSLNHVLALSATSNTAVNTSHLSGLTYGASYNLAKVTQQKNGKNTTTIILTESKNDYAALVVLYNTETTLNTSLLLISVSEKLN